MMTTRRADAPAMIFDSDLILSRMFVLVDYIEQMSGV